MIQNVLQEIGGVGMYGVISVCLFFAVFGAMFVGALRMSRTDAARLGAMPLGDDGAPGRPPRTASPASAKLNQP